MWTTCVILYTYEHKNYGVVALRNWRNFSAHKVVGHQNLDDSRHDILNRL